MQTATLEYQCDEKPLTVKLNNPRQEVSFVYDDQLLHLKQGVSASNVHITLTKSIFLSFGKSNEPTVYKRDRIVLNNCAFTKSTAFEEIFQGPHNSVTH